VGINEAMAEFDHWSRSYDQSFLQRFLFRPSHDLLIRHLHGSPGRVLDIGCGTGQFGARLLREHPQAQVVGFDLSSLMLDKAAARVAGLDGRFFLVRGNGEHLPFESDTFDAVTCSHSFHHYPDQAAAVAEMFRVLRPDGKLLIIDGDRDRFWGWMIYDVIVTWVEGQVHHCSAERLRGLYRTAGFQEVTQVKRRGLIPYLLTVGHAAKPAKAIPLARRTAA
jgi:ubiquinone/menaquinone biosynthesis C-methylase UbiE